MFSREPGVKRAARNPCYVEIVKYLFSEQGFHVFKENERSPSAHLVPDPFPCGFSGSLTQGFQIIDHPQLCTRVSTQFFGFTAILLIFPKGFQAGFALEHDRLGW
jgi:hypothetical protein